MDRKRESKQILEAVRANRFILKDHAAERSLDDLKTARGQRCKYGYRLEVAGRSPNVLVHRISWKKKADQEDLQRSLMKAYGL